MLKHRTINVEKLRQDFPLFNNGKQLVYLDNAATSQKPVQVIDAMNAYYMQFNANVHRGVYKISEIATEHYEMSHQNVADFIGCRAEEVIFTRNATEALNLVAYAYGIEHVSAGDNVVVSIMEHHSNFVPWQQLCIMKKAELRVVGVTSEGELDVEQLKRAVDGKTKIVALTHMSNVFGNVIDVKEISRIAHAQKAIMVVDTAQSAAHMPVNFSDLECDFLAFSGHKLLGPTGIGVLVGKKELLERMRPFMFGGDMIKSVSVEKTEWNELPWKFEAGTPNIAGAIGLARAIKYLETIGMEAVAAHEKELGAYALERLHALGGITIYGSRKPRGTISFNVDGVHAHDVATVLDSIGVCVRAGHHCCQPLMKQLGVSATVRVSFYIYNDKNEVDKLVEGLKKVKQVFGV